MNIDHPEVKFGKTGALIINLGTPDSTSWLDIRKYLKEFLSDRRVIEVNPIIWQMILNVFILTFRPSKTAKAYKEIWMNDINMSPLKYYTEMQMKKLGDKMNSDKIMVDYAMRYGNPSINSKIKKLQGEGCENLVILPLYPQYAAATTATVCDEVYRTLMKMRWQPSLKIIPHYESNPLYIDALVNSINKKISKKLKGQNVHNQERVDAIMINLDGSKQKNKLGANAILAVSMAVKKLSAKEKNIPLYKNFLIKKNFKLPYPMMNIINGGAHANNGLRIQEFMIRPDRAKNFSDAMRICFLVIKNLSKIIKNKGLSTSVGDEGGFAPMISNNNQALDLIVSAIRKSGFVNGKDCLLYTSPSPRD